MVPAISTCPESVGRRPQSGPPAERARVRPLRAVFRDHRGHGRHRLNVAESRSVFTFIIEAGPGISMLVAKNIALTACYRFQHFSNGGTSGPNRGYEAQSGVVGVAFFFR